jgi:hypothetical protein
MIWPTSVSMLAKSKNMPFMKRGSGKSKRLEKKKREL